MKFVLYLFSLLWSNEFSLLNTYIQNNFCILWITIIIISASIHEAASQFSNHLVQNDQPPKKKSGFVQSKNRIFSIIVLGYANVLFNIENMSLIYEKKCFLWTQELTLQMKLMHIKILNEKILERKKIPEFKINISNQKINVYYLRSFHFIPYIKKISDDPIWH